MELQKAQECIRQQKNWKKAVETYTTFLRNKNNSIEQIVLALFSRLECFFELNNYAAVINDCKSIIQITVNQNVHTTLLARKKLIHSLVLLHKYIDADRATKEWLALLDSEESEEINEVKLILRGLLGTFNSNATSKQKFINLMKLLEAQLSKMNDTSMQPFRSNGQARPDRSESEFQGNSRHTASLGRTSQLCPNRPNVTVKAKLNEEEAQHSRSSLNHTKEPLPIRALQENVMKLADVIARMQLQESSPPLATFRGAPHEEPEIFIRALETWFLQTLLATDYDRVTLAASQLRGQAKSWYKLYQNYPSTFAQFCGSLLGEYASPRRLNVLRTSLYCEIQAPSEKVSTFLRRKSALFRRLNPEASVDELIHLLTEQLLPSIRMGVRCARINDFHTLMDLCQKIESDLMEDAQMYKSSNSRSAAVAYQENPSTFSECRGRLLREYTSSQRLNMSRISLYCETQTPSEKVSTFLRRKSALFQRLNPGAPVDELIQLLIDQLLPSIRMCIRATRIDDFDKLMDLCENIESDLMEDAQMYKSSSNSRSAAITFSGQSQEVQRQNAGRAARRSRSRPPSDCQHCRGDHWHKRCPSRTTTAAPLLKLAMCDVQNERRVRITPWMDLQSGNVDRVRES